MKFAVCFMMTIVCLAWHISFAEERDDKTIPRKNEVAMKPRTQIVATTAAGTIKITSGEGCRRTYFWEGAQRSVEMTPRPERWFGSLGLYHGGFGYHWKEHNGISRCVSEEGQQNFKSESEALDWLEKRTRGTAVWRNDGLVVAWYKVPERKQLNVEVWQLLIDGKKPQHLTGSQDEEITVGVAQSSDDDESPEEVASAINPANVSAIREGATPRSPAKRAW